jgi:hypothetical protein
MPRRHCKSAFPGFIARRLTSISPSIPPLPSLFGANSGANFSLALIGGNQRIVRDHIPALRPGLRVRVGEQVEPVKLQIVQVRVLPRQVAQDKQIRLESTVSPAQTCTPPPETNPPPAQAYYGLGWSIRPVGKSAHWWHAGSLPGSSTLLVRTASGSAWALLFNARPRDEDYAEFQIQLDRLPWQAVEAVQAWPRGDLFEQF